jgi:ComF family protein
VFGGPPAFDWVRSVAAYDGSVKAAIKALKYHRAMPVGRVLADLLVAHLPRDRLGHVAAVVPVPLHPSRLRERGFNQAECLARPVAETLAVACRTDLLVRRRHEAAQAGLDGRARRLNVVGAFEATHAAAGLAAVLIDDVFSTGATADACSSALKRAGAASVGVLTLARAILTGTAVRA